MELFNNDDSTTKKYVPDNNIKGFFPRSELNDWTPLWEKLAFFLIGFLGLRLYSIIVQYIILATPLVSIKDGVVTVSNMAYALINFFTYLLLVITFVLFIFLDKRKTYQRILNELKQPKTYLWALVAFGMVIALQNILSLSFSALFPFYGSNANQNSIESIFAASPVLIFIMTVFFAPFCEELTYRIGLVDTIGHKYNLRWLGIAISALVFGLIHADIINSYRNLAEGIASGLGDAEITNLKNNLYNELLNLPVYMFSGFALGFVYAKSGKITSSMMGHMGVNLLSMIITIIQMASKNA